MGYFRFLQSSNRLASNTPAVRSGRGERCIRHSLGVESLEPRHLLAANVIGYWAAEDLVASHASGDAIAQWRDSVDNVTATAQGAPRLIADGLNGFPVVRFDPADGDDLFRVVANDSPMGGVDDFTVAVVFATASQQLRGDGPHWFQQTGLVDTNLLGIFEDWGLTINDQGQLAAGLGRPSRTQLSSLTGYHDGGAHVAIYTRRGSTMSLFVDGNVDIRTDGGTTARAARDMTFGGLTTMRGPFDGDIAEIRLYDTQLTSLEANQLTTELLAKYFNAAPLANLDAYSVNEDETLTVDVARGVLANDTDPEGDSLTAAILSQPEYGTIGFSADGSFVYRPNVNFAGLDSFTYAARDARNSLPANVIIEVVEQDDPPVPAADTYLLQTGQAITTGVETGVLANDVNLGTTTLTAELATDVDHGILTLNSDGTFFYAPPTDFAGIATFAYRVTGGNATIGPVVVELLVNRHPVVISEIMASNRSTLRDEDGDSSDWIELYNYGDHPIDLEGWYLTDDPRDLTGWAFPSVTLAPSQFLTVFASGKVRDGANTDGSTGQLHADFQLSAGGEYLALVDVDGQTVVSHFPGGFPPQLTDVSYGIATPAMTTVLVDGSSASQFTVPTDDRLGLNWTEATFEPDDTWLAGPAAVGFDAGTAAPDRGEYASTVLADSPVGYWRFEEAEGNIAENSGSLGTAANGTYWNGADNDIDGPLLGSGDLAGRFQQARAHKIDVPHVQALNPQDLSFEVWARVDGGSGYRSPLTSRGNSPQEGFIFYATPGNTWQMWTGTGQQVGWTVLAGPDIELGKWTHLVGTYDNESKTQRFYVDGVRVASVTNIHAEPNNADPLRIGGGATEGDGNYFFDGAVDEVAVYDHALSSARIKTHFDAARTNEVDGGIAEFAGTIQLDVEAAMRGVNASGYLRVPFVVSSPATLDTLTLKMQYDDGFVAYLNGQKVAERNTPVPVHFDSAATAEQPDRDAIVAETIDLSAFVSLLSDGQNVLAIHGLNRSDDGDDFLLVPELIATSVDVSRFHPQYLASPSPGAVNGDEFAEVGPIVGQVEHTPVAPNAGEDLTVTARVHENSTPVATLILNYRFMYGDEFSTLMVDDGSLSGDLAGDGIYTGVITADTMAAAYPGGLAGLSGKMLRYSVVASDILSRDFRSPYLANPLNTDGVAEYYGTVIQDPAITTQLPVLQWFVPDPDWHGTGGNNNKNWSPTAVFFNGEFYDNVRVRVRGQTTVNWRKPKFKFEFNTGHKFRYADDESRVEEFNLQSHFLEKGAVSYMGENLAFGFLREIGVPAPNTMHMHVRQNGQFYSLASFIEQVDETFLERNGYDPAGPMYKAFSPAARSTLEPNPTASHYRKVNQADVAWDDLQEFTNAINNLIPGVDRSDYIFDHVNLPEVINDMAGNIILINHDRLTKNYYVYRDENGNAEWSRFPWDMDQAFAKRTDNIFASVLYGDSEHPQSSDPIHQNHLYDAILDTPFTRQMYMQRIRTLLDDYLAAGYFDPRIDEYHALIAEDAALDNARWGAGDIAAGVLRLRDNLTFRTSQLEADPLVPDAPSQIDLRFGEVEFNPISENQDEEFIEIVNHGASAVDLSGWRLIGGVELTLQPGTVLPAGGTLYATPNVVAFRGRVTGPSGGQGRFVQGDYDGHISNFGETIQLVDANSTVVDSVQTPVVPTDNQLFLRVSEVHFNPAGDDDTEFVELTNISTGPDSRSLDLSGVAMSDGPNEPFVFPAGISLEPGEYLVVVRDQTAFTATYPLAVDGAVGEFSGSLSNSGERIKLDDAGGSTILDFSYDDGERWPQVADGVGASLELIDLSTPVDRLSKPEVWQSSRPFGGTPMLPTSQRTGIVISEILAHTDPPVETNDSIELFNGSNNPVDLSGWFLSDSSDDLLKYEIPAGTVLAAGEYRVFDERDFNPTPLTPAPQHFALSGTLGDDVWLVTPDGSGGISSFVDDVHFLATSNGQSLSLTRQSHGRLVPATRTTLGCGGANPLVGDVVISEINYLPAPPTAAALSLDPTLDANDLEYIEINGDSLDLNLDGWRIRGGIEFEFPDVVLSGYSLLVLSFNPDSPANARKTAAFREQYSLAADVLLIGGYAGSLSDSGEQLRLERPVDSPTEAPEQITYVSIDEVIYDTIKPWPERVGELGQTLSRRAPVFFGNDGHSWSAAAASPLGDPFEGNVLGDLNGDRVLTATDIDLLIDAVKRNRGFYYVLSSTLPAPTAEDVEFLVERLMNTSFGDANLDQTVDASDLNQVGIHWLSPTCGTWATGDFNGDGRVNAADLNQLGINWQTATLAPVQIQRTPRAPLAAKLRPGSQFVSTTNVSVHAGSEIPRQDFAWKRFTRSGSSRRIATEGDRQRPSVDAIDVVFARMDQGG